MIVVFIAHHASINVGEKMLMLTWLIVENLCTRGVFFYCVFLFYIPRLRQKQSLEATINRHKENTFPARISVIIFRK